MVLRSTLSLRLRLRLRLGLRLTGTVMMMNGFRGSNTFGIAKHFGVSRLSKWPSVGNDLVMKSIYSSSTALKELPEG